MSLDVYLIGDKRTPLSCKPTIFIREDGENKKITREEWDIRFPGREPVMATPGDEPIVYHGNITHNLKPMACEANMAQFLWDAEETGINEARELIEPLRTGLKLLRSDPERFKKLNPANGWGTYEGFVRFVERYLKACKENPDTKVSIWK